MARPRKVLKFAEILNPLSIAELKQLKDEITTEIRVKARVVATIPSSSSSFLAGGCLER